jgi:hypothetical protein
VPYRRGKPRKGTLPSARLIERRSAPGLDVLVGEATSTCYEARHTRRIVFVADAYWIVQDRLTGERAHRYDLRFHLGAEAQGRVEVQRAGDAHVVRAPGVALVVAGGGAPAIEAGWVSPDYGVKRDAPVVSVVVDGTADATFTTVVMPLADGAPAPGLEVSAEGDLAVARVTHDGVTDTVKWCDGGRPLDLGPLRSRASAGWMREDAAGVARVRTAGVGGAAVWAGWDRACGMSAGAEGAL